MASDYGLNFGFRRSDESMAIREGRQKTPVGVALRQGSAVMFDAAAPGFMKVAPASETPIAGTHGLLVQEEAHLSSIYSHETLATGHDSFGLGLCKPNQLSVIWSGAGTKVWFKNTGSQARIDGRQIEAVELISVAGLVLMDDLGWDGTKWAKANGGTVKPWAKVTLVNVAAGYAEAVLTY